MQQVYFLDKVQKDKYHKIYLKAKNDEVVSDRIEPDLIRRLDSINSSLKIATLYSCYGKSLFISNTNKHSYLYFYFSKKNEIKKLLDGLVIVFSK